MATIGFLNSRARWASRSKPHRAVKPLDVKPKAGNAVILDQAERHFRQTGLSLIACRHQEGDRQPALLHGKIAGDVGRLGDDCRAARAGGKALPPC